MPENALLANGYASAGEWLCVDASVERFAKSLAEIGQA
jgi:hypothetical protein